MCHHCLRIGQSGHLGIKIRPKNTELIEDMKSCFLSSYIGFLSAVSEEKSKISQPIRPGSHIGFPIGLKENTNLGVGVRYCFQSSFVEFCSAIFRREIENVGHLVFSIGPKNTNLIEDTKILLRVKFLWILFSGFRGEVENAKRWWRTTRDQNSERAFCSRALK